MISKTRKQKIEEKFHDEYAELINTEDINVKEFFSFAAQENKRALKEFGNLKGKKILDLGCGTGEAAVYFAQKGALVDAIDISKNMIRIGQKLAKKNNVSKNCIFQQMTSENLRYSDNNFDYIFGNGVLHHVDIQKSAVEIRRTLKKGGKAVFIEPLAYNPIIEIYRKIAKDVRTSTEKPVSFDQIKKLNRYFSSVVHEEYEFLTLLIFVWFFLVARVSPNQERYWRKILEVKGRLKKILRFLIALDRIVLKVFLPARYLCWNTVIIIEK